VDTSRSRAALIALLIASAYAVTDEYHQSFVPMRTPDPADWALDTLGALAGVLGMAWLESIRAKRRAGSG
jgi:VanZ family protein